MKPEENVWISTYDNDDAGGDDDGDDGGYDDGDDGGDDDGDDCCYFVSLRQERRETFLLQSQLCVLTLIRCPFHSRVTAMAGKRPRSYGQKCR